VVVRDTDLDGPMPDKPAPARRFPRYLAEYAVLVRKAGKIGSEKLAKTRTIGGGGCMFIYHESLAIGTEVDLMISLPGGVIKAEARVVWETVPAPYRYEIGVEFLRMTPDDRETFEDALAGLAAAHK
jgi:hypothetical protein